MHLLSCFCSRFCFCCCCCCAAAIVVITPALTHAHVVAEFLLLLLPLALLQLLLGISTPASAFAAFLNKYFLHIVSVMNDDVLSKQSSFFNINDAVSLFSPDTVGTDTTYLLFIVYCVQELTGFFKFSHLIAA